MRNYKGRIDRGFVTRGAEVLVPVDGKPRRGVVVTHIRNGRWMVEIPSMPSKTPYCRLRVTCPASDLSPWVPPPTTIRAARSPIERMIDQACGLGQDAADRASR